MHIALGNLNHAKHILKMINIFAVFIYSAFIKCFTKSFHEIISSSHRDHLYKVFRIEQSERELYINLNLYSLKTHHSHTQTQNWARPERFAAHSQAKPLSHFKYSLDHSKKCRLASFPALCRTLLCCHDVMRRLAKYYNIYFIFEFQHFISVSAAAFLNAFY